MKIIYISDSIIPSRTANSIHIMKMCQAFAENGNEVTLIAPDHPDIELSVDNIYNYYGVKENFYIRKLPWKNIKGRAYLYALEAAKLANKLKPDIIYGRFLTGCFFASMISKSPIIFESHQPVIDAGKIQELLFKKIIKRNNFKRLVLITNSLKNYYRKNYNIRENILLVAHDGADIPPTNIVPANLKNTDSNKINVGYVGQLYTGKGMEIISELAQHCQWANFHIIGGLEKDINYWKEQTKGIKNIFYYGFIPHSQTVRYIKACDVLIAPYKYNVKGYGKGRTNLSMWMSPLKLFEYMSLGKAIICSNLPVLREVLTHKKNALLCEPNDLNEWIEALKMIYFDKKLRKQLGINAYKDFKQNYTWTSRAKNVIKNL